LFPPMICLLNRYLSVTVNIIPVLSTYVHTYMHACMHAYIHTYIHTYIHRHTRVYPKVSGLAACSENCKWYSSLPLGAVVSLFCEPV
jgi:hypothetical protein